jgi:hypothetical protein
MYEAKQMKQAVGAASRLVDFPPPCESAASQYRVGLLRFESGRVLVLQGSVFGRSSRMTGNLQVRFLESWAPAMAPGHSTTRKIHFTDYRVFQPTGITCGLLVIYPRCPRWLKQSFVRALAFGLWLNLINGYQRAISRDPKRRSCVVVDLDSE